MFLGHSTYSVPSNITFSEVRVNGCHIDARVHASSCILAISVLPVVHY